MGPSWAGPPAPITWNRVQRDVRLVDGCAGRVGRSGGWAARLIRSAVGRLQVATGGWMGSGGRRQVIAVILSIDQLLDLVAGPFRIQFHGPGEVGQCDVGFAVDFVDLPKS